MSKGAYQCAEGEMHGGPQFGLLGSLAEVLGPRDAIRVFKLQFWTGGLHLLRE